MRIDETNGHADTFIATPGYCGHLAAWTISNGGLIARLKRPTPGYGELVLLAGQPSERDPLTVHKRENAR